MKAHGSKKVEIAPILQEGAEPLHTFGRPKLSTLVKVSKRRDEKQWYWPQPKYLLCVPLLWGILLYPCSSFPSPQAQLHPVTKSSRGELLPIYIHQSACNPSRFYSAVCTFCRIFRHDTFLPRRSGYGLYSAFLFNSPHASSSSHGSDVRVDIITYLPLVVRTMVQVESLRQKVAEQPSPGLILPVRVYAVE